MADSKFSGEPIDSGLSGSDEDKLSILIDGRWTAEDFSTFLRAAEDIQNLYLVLHAKGFLVSAEDKDLFSLDRRGLRNYVLESLSISPLRVDSISYSSPGQIIFACLTSAGGLSGLLAAVKFILDRNEDRRGKRLDNDLKQVELDHKKSEYKYLEARRPEVDQIQDRKLLADINQTEIANARNTYELAANFQIFQTSDLSNAFGLKRYSDENNLNPEQTAKVSRWLEGKAKKIEQLASSGQIVGIDGNDSVERPTGRE